MVFEIQAIDRPGTFRLTGEFDLAAHEAFVARMEPVSASGLQILLELSDVTFMDSSGLRAILGLTRSVNGQGPVVLLNPSRQVQRVLEIALPAGAPGLEVRSEAGVLE